MGTSEKGLVEAQCTQPVVPKSVRTFYSSIVQISFHLIENNFLRRFCDDKKKKKKKKDLIFFFGSFSTMAASSTTTGNGNYVIHESGDPTTDSWRLFYSMQTRDESTNKAKDTNPPQSRKLKNEN
jgi:hypothetical protein